LLLANIYLHYVLDLWTDHWRKTQARGNVIAVRFADDFIAGFQYQDDAERFLGELRGRLAKSAERVRGVIGRAGGQQGGKLVPEGLQQP
jgi:hypothetical protein